MGLTDVIRSHAAQSPLPWGESGMTITPEAVQRIADEFNIPGWQVEAHALKNDVFPLRYVRNMHSISQRSQIQLLESTIALVGLGGLGGTILEHCLRLGIGTIRAVDGDIFEASNLNRQLLSSIDSMETSKAHTALERARAINPSASLETNQEVLDHSSLPSFLAGCDIAIDALGGLKDRLALQMTAAESGIPLITGALAGWSGYVSVVLPGRNGPADIMGHDNAAEEQLGCPSPAVGTVASLMAGELVSMLTSGASSLAGKMLVIDLTSTTFETISI